MTPAVYLLFTFCVNYTPISSATQTIRARGCSEANPIVLPRNLKIAPTTLPTIADNASTALPASLLRVSTTLFNHFSKAPLSFGGDNAETARYPPPPPRTPVIASTIVDMVIERAVSIDTIAKPCSQDKVQMCSTKDLSSSKTFSIVCLTPPTYVRRSFRFWDSI